MKDFLIVAKLAAYVFALPLLATAAVSAHQFFQPDDTISSVAVAKTSVSENTFVGLADTYRQHTIAKNEDGLISGQVWLVDSASKNGLADSKVFFVKDGKIAKQVYTNPDGSFSVKGLETGAYSFVVSNVEGVATFGVNIVDDENAQGQMEVVVVSKNSSEAEKVLNKNGEELENVKLTRESVRGSNVAKLVDGELAGRLYSTYRDVDFTDAVVKIFNTEKEVVAEVKTDADGNFVVADLENGYYEFVAAGPQGYAAFGFEAIESTEVYTSTVQDTFDAMVTSPADNYYVNDCGTCGIVGSPIEFAGSCTSCSGAYNACGGGCGAGGGLLGGGFGGPGGIGGVGSQLGRLLPLTALAVGVAALADDGGTGGDPPPVSPAVVGIQ
jgi:hypothetical protein